VNQLHTLFCRRRDDDVLTGYSAVCLSDDATDTDRDSRADPDTVRRYSGRSSLSMVDRVLCLTADRDTVPRSILQRVPLFYSETGGDSPVVGNLIPLTE
jgi:hypothetical protein